MASPPGGVRIQGVRPGSAGEKAGMKGGDILIQLGTRKVPDLQEMTKALQNPQCDCEPNQGDNINLNMATGEVTY